VSLRRLPSSSWSRRNSASSRSRHPSPEEPPRHHEPQPPLTEPFAAVGEQPCDPLSVLPISHRVWCTGASVTAYYGEPPLWAGGAAAVAPPPCWLSHHGPSISVSMTKIRRARYPFGLFNHGRRSPDEWLTLNEVLWTHALAPWTRSTASWTYSMSFLIRKLIH
jgi:hypothetical protein